MAQTDDCSFPVSSDNANGTFSVPPAEALARLSLLHREAAIALRLSHFCARALPVAAALLVLAGVFAFAGGGAAAPAIAWSLLLAAGLAVLFANNRKGRARPFAGNLAAIAANMRAILVYLGFAWGAGAFLMLGPAPYPGLLAAFALLPSFAVAGCSGDVGGAIAFAAPVTGLGLAAALLRGDAASAGAILILQAALALLLYKAPGRSMSAGLT